MHVCVWLIFASNVSRKKNGLTANGVVNSRRVAMHEIDLGSIGGGQHDLDAKLKDVVMMVEEKI